MYYFSSIADKKREGSPKVPEGSGKPETIGTKKNVSFEQVWKKEPRFVECSGILAMNAIQPEDRKYQRPRSCVRVTMLWHNNASCTDARSPHPGLLFRVTMLLRDVTTMILRRESSINRRPIGPFFLPLSSSR